MSSKPVVLEEIRHPTRFQLYHVPPEIPFRRAKEFRLKRRKLIHEGVAETVDFKDILSRSRRFLESGNHSFPAKKPVVIESRVAAALNQQGNKSSISGRPDTAVQLGYFKLYGQFGHDSSAMQSDERCMVDSGWPDYKYESAESLHESRLFDDVTSRNVTGAAEDHRSLLLSSCVKQYKPQMTNGCITWSDDFETICDPTISSSADTFEEPFRDVPYVIREIIRERLHLLESHLVNVHEKDSTTNVNVNVDVDVGVDTNDIDIGAMTDDNFNPEDLAASCGITEDDFLYDYTTGRERNQNMTDNNDENDNISGVKKSKIFSNIENSCPAASSDQNMESMDQDLMPDWIEKEPAKHNYEDDKKNENENENENGNDEDDIYNTGYYDNDDGDEYDSDENSCGERSDDVIVYGGGSPTLEYSNTSENEESKCDQVTNETDYDDMSVDDNTAQVNQSDEEDIYNINYFSSSKKQNKPKRGKSNAKIKVKGRGKGEGNGKKERNVKQTAPRRKKNKIKEDEMEIDNELKYSDSNSDSNSDCDSDSDGIGMAVDDNDNNRPTTQPHTMKVKIQIKSEYSLPDGIFETAARKILFPIYTKNNARKHRKHAKNVLLNKEHSSTPTHLPLPSCPDDEAALVGELYDNQIQSMECLLGRHMEGVIDGLIILVFNYFKPYAEMLRKDQREEEKLNNFNAEEVIKKENGGSNLNNENEIENFSNRPKRKSVVKQYKNENENEDENDRENSNESESDYDNDSENENRSISRNVKRNNMSISTQQIKNEYKEKEKDKDKGKAENILNKNNDKEIIQKRNFRNRHVMKRHASQSTQHDMWATDSYVDHSLAPPSAKPLFNWEHVLLAVQDYADSLLKLNSSNITMPYDLPDIRLTPDVMRRVQGRLLGIFGGVRAKGLDPNPPRVIRRHRDPIFGSSKGVVRRRLRMKSTKIRAPLGIHRNVEVAAREESDDQEEEEEEVEGQQQEQEREEGEQEQEEEEEEEGEQYEEMYVEEEEGDDGDISGKLSSIEKLEIQKEILRNLLAYKKGEKGQNSESENEDEDEEDEIEVEDESILKKRRRHFLRNRVRLRIDDNKNKNDIKNEGNEGNQGKEGNEEEVEGSSIPNKKWRTRSLNDIVHDKRAKMMAIYQKKLSNLTKKKEKEKKKKMMKK